MSEDGNFWDKMKNNDMCKKYGNQAATLAGDCVKNEIQKCCGVEDQKDQKKDDKKEGGGDGIMGKVTGIFGGDDSNNEEGGGGGNGMMGKMTGIFGGDDSKKEEGGGGLGPLFGF